MRLDVHKQLFAKQTSYAVSDGDRKQGIVGYLAYVTRCDVTGKETNCLYLTPSGHVRAAYDQQAANQLP